MREVKFRLWCGNKKEWEKDEWNITQNGIIVDTRRKVQLKKETHFLSQYTGLKDKNDVEIYEGDIIKYEDGTISEVVFDKYILSYRTKIGYLIGIFEVIGNIYENQELL